MELLILRHAIAEEENPSDRGIDSKRRLTLDGARKMRRIAKGMKALKLKPDLILTSTYARALETAQIVAKTFHCAKILKETSTLVPDGNPKELLEALKQDHSQCERVLIVGHEPYLSSLVSLLLSGQTDVSVTMKKGGLCGLSIDEVRYGRCANLEWLLTPAQLRKVK